MSKSPHPVDRIVGDRVRRCRLKSKQTQGELAAAMGVSFQQIGKYEKGQTRIGAGRLQKFAQEFEVSVEYFFEGLSGSARTAKRAVVEVDPLEALLSIRNGLTLVKAFRRIQNRTIRRSIIKMLEALADGPS